MGRGVLYCSTRGGAKDVTFEEVVLGGLAPDKGLYVPQEIPQISPEQLEKVRWIALSPQTFAVGIRSIRLLWMLSFTINAFM